MLRSQPSVVIVEAYDVILAEVLTVLDVNEHQGNGAGVLYPVRSAACDIDSSTGPHIHVAPIEHDTPCPATMNQCSERRACRW